MPGIVFVPTELERRTLEELGGLGAVDLCGFGPVAAAARTTKLLLERRPDRVLLVGIAGTYDARAAAIGSALEIGHVAIDGFDAAGFEPWPGIGSALDLGEAPAVLVTVLAPSSSRAEADARRRRHEGALAEDMEGYGVAVACRMAGIPLAIVRGISNEAGDRDAKRWRIREALSAARRLALGRLA